MPIYPPSLTWWPPLSVHETLLALNGVGSTPVSVPVTEMTFHRLTNTGVSKM